MQLKKCNTHPTPCKSEAKNNRKKKKSNSRKCDETEPAVITPKGVYHYIPLPFITIKASTFRRRLSSVGASWTFPFWGTPCKCVENSALDGTRSRQKSQQCYRLSDFWRLMGVKMPKPDRNPGFCGDVSAIGGGG